MNSSNCYNCTDLYKELKFDELKSYDIQRKKSPIKSLYNAIRKNVEDKNTVSENAIDKIYNLIDEFAVEVLNHDAS